MPKIAALFLLGLASAVILVVFVVPVPGGEELFAVLAAAFPVALFAVGALRHGRLVAVGVPLTVLLAILEGSVVGMLAFRGEVMAGPWLGGLPLAAALELLGLGLVPLLVVALAYALTFDRCELPEEELTRLRRQEWGD